jgi:NADH-quinone oxidoreductase subunit J
VIIAVSCGSVLLIALIAGIFRTKFNSQAFPEGSYPMDALGQALLGDFLVPFELASVLLLVVMIGAAYLAKGRKREEEAPAIERRLSQQAKQWS